MSKLVKKPFVSGLLGGLVVAVVGAFAISVGWIKSESSQQTVIKQQPITKPSPNNEGDKGPTVSQIYDDAGPGVVYIKSEISSEGGTGPFGLPLPGGQPKQEATGSGFVIDSDGHIVTNAHVVDEDSEVDVRLGKDKNVSAKVVGKDTSSDIALLKVDASKDDLKPLPLGNSKGLRVGDPVIAIGNPFGLDRTVTTGIVSALQRELQAPNGFTINDVIQTDASINPGNSGGPLLDANGQVIGINSQIASQSGGSEGIGFAVPINTVKKELPQLKEKGSFDRAYLGITGVSLRSPLLKDLNLPVDKGVLIQDVTKDGPADKAGLKAGDTQVTVNGEPVVLGGDIIVEIDGMEIKSMKQIVNVVNGKKPDDGVQVTYLRDKKKQTKTIMLGKRPNKLIR